MVEWHRSDLPSWADQKKEKNNKEFRRQGRRNIEKTAPVRFSWIFMAKMLIYEYWWSFLNVILQSLTVWDWYIHKNGAERAPEMVKKGAGQVFFNFLATNANLWSLMKFLNVILQVLIVWEWCEYKTAPKERRKWWKRAPVRFFSIFLTQMLIFK